MYMYANLRIYNLYMQAYMYINNNNIFVLIIKLDRTQNDTISMIG